MRAVAEKQVAYHLKRHPDFSIPQKLVDADCHSFATRVRQHLQTIDVRRLVGTPT